MSELANRKCVPCEGGVEPLGRERAVELLATLQDGWRLDDECSRLSREFRFPAFSRTIAFVNAVAFVATNEGHHPELHVSYGSCRVVWYTTAIGGLSDNDFICAAKIDRLVGER